jgi:thiol-disulfide isomerase/thioredoxin
MTSIVLVLRLVMVAVFGVAACAKLADLDATRDTVAAFGVPRRYAKPAGTLLPFAELATAVALVPQASVRWGAVAAIALLAIFVAGIVGALARGLAPDCNCFGQLSSSQIGWPTLARNGALVVVAGVVVWKAPGSALTDWTTNTSAANLVAAGAVIALTFACVAIVRYRQLTASLRVAVAAAGTARPSTLALGQPAPAFTLPDLDGADTSLSGLLERGLPVVLVFASPVCGPCQQLIPELARWNAAVHDNVSVVVIESGMGQFEDLTAHLPASDGLIVVVEPGLEIAAAYRVNQTPTAIAIAPDGTISSPPTPGAGAIERLVRSTLKHHQAQLVQA